MSKKVFWAITLGACQTVAIVLLLIENNRLEAQRDQAIEVAEDANANTREAHRMLQQSFQDRTQFMVYMDEELEKLSAFAALADDPSPPPP